MKFQSAQGLALLACSTGLASARPNGFSLRTEHVPRSGANVELEAYFKHNPGKGPADLPARLKDAYEQDLESEHLYKRAKGTAGYGSIYAMDSQIRGDRPKTKIEVGCQSFMVALDTSSSMTWLASSELSDSAFIKYKTPRVTYDPTKCTTSKTDGVTFSNGLSNGGSVKGTYYTDSIKTTLKGGIPFQDRRDDIATVGVPDMEIGLVSEASGLNLASTMSGVLGLMWRGDTTPSFFERLAPTLEEPEMSIMFDAHDAENPHNGIITFGDLGFQYQQRVSKTYHDVVSSTGAWDIKVEGYEFGEKDAFNQPLTYWQYNKRNGNMPEEEGIVVLDSSSDKILLPNNVVDAYYKIVKGAYMDLYTKLYYFPCKTELPEFTLQNSIQPLFIIGKYMTLTKSTTPGMCIGSLQRANSDEKFVLGLPFFYAKGVALNTRGGKAQITLSTGSQIGSPFSDKRGRRVSS